MFKNSIIICYGNLCFVWVQIARNNLNYPVFKNKQTKNGLIKRYISWICLYSNYFLLAKI